MDNLGVSILEFNKPYGPEYEYECLKVGDAFTTACQLRGLLTEMFRSHQLLATPEVRVYFRIYRDWLTYKVPFSWKSRVHNAQITIAAVGFFEENFVIWGPMIEFGETGFYQPYILLANLEKSTVSMETLGQKGLKGKIFKFLHLWIMDRKAYFMLEEELNELKEELDKLA